MEANENTTVNSYLSFRLEKEAYATNVAKVLEILENTTITEVPRAPEYFKGVINLRGEVLPVVDTKVIFSLPPIVETTDTCIIVLNIDMDGETLKFGAMVDAVMEVFELEDKDLLPPSRLGSSENHDLITALSKLDEKFVMILDVDKIFSTDEFLHLVQVNKDELETLEVEHKQ